MKKELSTKIIAGKYKGKKIKLPSKEVTRSSKNILRESLFNTLQYEVIDKNFVEVFGGSGSVGLEALSRGAKHVYFIEFDRQSFKTLSQNTKLLDEKSCTVILGDAFERLFDVIDELQKKDERAYFYFDPPFSIREGMEDIYDKVFELIKKIPENVTEMIIIEHMTKMDMPDIIGKYKFLKKRKFGKSSLSYYMVERES
ncbi:16S rRNA (guanine(966)-N(2))-methyltransferase RsmD [Nitrosophilus labii]|uniref:16S rRNA (guanine(966)-N(2))-methyltransferase RsmD n=1 Tax=Nitrosophilus labii TaxID=2706014 RepID=UPI001656AA94|nr:16S rRNA (guanine(966)-N(2))-methyltransferase RsmD [Nitrosophilus labii]